MKNTKHTKEFKVTAKYKAGKGLRFKLGTLFLSIGTQLISNKVTIYLEKTKVGELTPSPKQ